MYIPTNKTHQDIIRKVLCEEDEIYKKIICLLSLSIQFQNFIETDQVDRIKQLKVLFVELDTLDDLRKDMYEAVEGSLFYPFMNDYKKYVLHIELLQRTEKLQGTNKLQGIKGGSSRSKSKSKSRSKSKSKSKLSTCLTLLMCVNPNIASVVTEKKVIANQLKQLYPVNYKSNGHRRLSAISEYLPSRFSYTASVLINNWYGPKSSRDLNMFLTPNHNGICVWNSQSYLASPATIQTMLVKFKDYYSNIKRRYAQTVRRGFTEGPVSDMGMKLEYKPVTLSNLQENILSIMDAAKGHLGSFTPSSVIVIGLQFVDSGGGDRHAFNVIVDTESPTEGCVVDTNYVTTGSGEGFFCTDGFDVSEGVVGVHKSPTLSSAVENYLNLMYKIRRPVLEIEDPENTNFSITTMEEINEGFTASREGREYLLSKFHGVNSEGYMTRPQLEEYITSHMQTIIDKRKQRSSSTSRSYMSKSAYKTHVNRLKLSHNTTARMSSHNSRRSRGKHK